MLVHSVVLQLADVKGVDRKTSLLQFVVQQVQAEDPGVCKLAEHMSHVRPAATMQLSAVSAMVGEIRLGLKKVSREAEAAEEAAAAVKAAEKDGLDTTTTTTTKDEEEVDSSSTAPAPPADSSQKVQQDAAIRFAEAMASFHSTAFAEFSALEEEEKATMADLKATCEYFGEEFAATDPVRVVRTVRDFMLLLEKAVSDLVARAEKEAEAAKRADQLKQKTATSGGGGLGNAGGGKKKGETKKEAPKQSAVKKEEKEQSGKEVVIPALPPVEPSSESEMVIHKVESEVAVLPCSTSTKSPDCP